MKLPQHWLRLTVSPASNAGESIDIVTRRDVQWGSPIFRAPALPTPNQLCRELPFTTAWKPQFTRTR